MFTQSLLAAFDAEILPVDVIPDPVDRWVAVVYCPCCDNAYGVTTAADEDVAREILASHGVTEPIVFDGIGAARLTALRLVLDEEVGR